MHQLHPADHGTVSTAHLLYKGSCGQLSITAIPGIKKIYRRPMWLSMPQQLWSKSLESIIFCECSPIHKQAKVQKQLHSMWQKNSNLIHVKKPQLHRLCVTWDMISL